MSTPPTPPTPATGSLEGIAPRAGVRYGPLDTPSAGLSVLPPWLADGVLPQPSLARVPGTRLFELREAYGYYDRARGHLLWIPAGFQFDGASVPRAVRGLVDDDDLRDVAPLVHDWCYRHGGVLPDGACYTRAEADRLFRTILEQDGVRPRWKREASYHAVRLRGGRHWKPAGPRVQRIMEMPV